MEQTLLEAHLEAMVELARGLEGHLRDDDVRFLALAGATLAPSLGEVLEIGSFLGKSTVVLARSVGFAGGDRVVAVDPLTLPASTDPPAAHRESLPQRFHAALASHGVDDVVEFHRQRSEDVGREWNRPLRLLWIDGDHTYAGAASDFEFFRRHLRPGAVVALHDVLNPFEGPLRVFCEHVLDSPQFGASGVCGSIGWARYVGPTMPNDPEQIARRRLARSLRRLLPFVASDHGSGKAKRRLYKLARTFVKHGCPDLCAWLRANARLHHHG